MAIQFAPNEAPRQEWPNFTINMALVCSIGARMWTLGDIAYARCCDKDAIKSRLMAVRSRELCREDPDVSFRICRGDKLLFRSRILMMGEETLFHALLRYQDTGCTAIR